MSEPRVNDKKLTARNIGIALGIISIILGMSLLWTIDIYNGTNTSLNSQVKNLQSQVNDLNNITFLNSTYIWVNNQNISIAPKNYFSWTNFQTYYAGYIVVLWTQSTVSNCYAQVIWKDTTNAYRISNQYVYYGPINYNNRINFGNMTTLGTNGYAAGVFAVLPTFGGGSLEIRVGNNDTEGTAIGNVTITFNF